MSKNAMAGCKRRDTFLVPPDRLVLITDTCDPLFDKRAEEQPDERLVLNIMAIGVQEPVVARKSGGEAQVIAGRRRVLAAREANRRAVDACAEPINVPTIFVRGEVSALLPIMASENELREPDNPLERARKAARLFNHGHNEDAVAVFFGVQRQTINKWLRILDNAHPEVLAAIEDGKLGITAADKLARLDRDKQAGELAECIADEKTSARDVERRVSRSRGASPTRSKPKAALVRKVQHAVSDEQMALSFNGDGPSKEVAAVLGWVTGTLTEGEAVSALPWLSAVISAEA